MRTVLLQLKIGKRVFHFRRLVKRSTKSVFPCWGRVRTKAEEKLPPCSVVLGSMVELPGGQVCVVATVDDRGEPALLVPVTSQEAAFLVQDKAVPQAPPKTPPMPRVLIVVEGGNVQSVLFDGAPQGLEAAVIDHDVNDEEDPTFVREGGEEYYLFRFPVDRAPDTVKRKFRCLQWRESKKGAKGTKIP